MCGRFGINVKEGWDVKRNYQIDFETFIKLIESKLKKKNIAPADSIITFIKENKTPIPEVNKWGIKFSESSPLIFNSRIETISKKPFWFKLFDKNRCVVPMTEFYEWKKEGGRKIPHRIYLKSEKLFFVPGLMHIDKGKKFVSLITTVPNDFIKQIHHRMPVILHLDQALKYLSGDAESNLKECVPYKDADNMEMEETEL
jgi:putative SOS response-associated peptidase YedK